MANVVISISLILLLYVNISCAAQDEQSQDDDKFSGNVPLVRELTNEFTRHYHEIAPMLIMFYTPWCSYSQQLQPLLTELARVLADSVMISRVDISLYTDIARFFQIKETPTVIYVKNGRSLVCEQELTFEGLLQFAIAVHGPHVYEVNNTVDLNHWMGNYSVVFLLVHDQEISSSWHNVYVSVAAQKKANQRFLYTTDSEMIQNKFGVKQFPSLLVLKEGQAFVYDEPVTHHAMSIWIDNERLPLLVWMNITTAKRYTKLPPGKKMVLSLLDKKSHQKVYNIIERLAEGRRFHSGYQFAWTDDESLITTITGSSLPVQPLLLVWDTEKWEFYLLQANQGDDELTAKLITTFLLDVSKQKIQPQVTATDYWKLLESLVAMIYGMCWAMYMHRPFLSLAAVMMPLLGVYLLLCGPKKKEPLRRSRPLRNQRRQQRQEHNRAQVDTVAAGNFENQTRKRNLNRTSQDDNVGDTHSN